jgi:transposase
MWNALVIRKGHSAEELRDLADTAPNRRAAMRMRAIAIALDGMSRAEAAQAAGMSRQALRDAVVRYNAEGLAGLYDRPKPGRPCRLTGWQLVALQDFRGPRGGGGPKALRSNQPVAIAVVCGYCEDAFGVSYTHQAMRRFLKRPGWL